MATALVVVDLQYDFLPNGSLAVINGDTIINKIHDLLDIEWNLVVATQDWHPRNHISFASQHNVTPFQELEFSHPLKEENTTGHVKTTKQIVWPDHCIQGTKGADLEASILQKFMSLKIPKAIVKKGYLSDREYYSCFNDIWKSHTTEMENHLKENNIKSVIFVGLAYDFCVLNSARDCASLGYDTYVVKNCTRSVYPEMEEQTNKQYIEAGIKIIDYPENFPWKNFQI